MRCGLEQAFAESSWQTAIDHAHAVGDLAGSPEGRNPSGWLSIAAENPFKAVTTAVHQQSGMVSERGMQVPTSLRTTAIVAEPKCVTCNVSLVFRSEGTELVSRCSRCSETRKYRLPPGARERFPGLVGVMTDEHRSDQLVTRVDDDRERPGAVALSCPSCGGALQVAPGERIVACGYCGASSRIPEKVYLRAGDPNLRPEPWWLAFDGPSRTRRRLERDPAIPREPGDEATDIQAVEPPKRKKAAPADLALVIILPLLFLMIAGLLDYLVLGQLELDLSAF